jgi:hypothetical protein
MKIYISSILIPCLLLQFSGCYSMQKVTKDEFLQASDYPELFIKTKEKEFKFEQGSYTFQKDTIFGKGEFIMRSNEKYLYEPFEGRISVNDVEKIETDKMNNASDTSNLILKTKDKEFIFKFDESSYSVKNDTIYGKGKYRFRNVDDQFEDVVSTNDVEEIQIDKFNLAPTIVLVSVLVLTIAGVIAIADGVGGAIW